MEDKKKIYIREALITDVQNILLLIKEIAHYEHMENEVEATVDILTKSIFIDKKASVLLAYFDNDLAGYLVYFNNFSTFIGKAGYFIEDIYVKEQYRRNHIGRYLFKKLAELASLNDIKRIDWCCLDWNKPSLDFYKEIGGISKDEWVYHRLDDNGINNLIKK